MEPLLGLFNDSYVDCMWGPLVDYQLRLYEALGKSVTTLEDIHNQLATAYSQGVVDGFKKAYFVCISVGVPRCPTLSLLLLSCCLAKGRRGDQKLGILGNVEDRTLADFGLDKHCGKHQHSRPTTITGHTCSVAPQGLQIRWPWKPAPGRVIQRVYYSLLIK